MPLIFIAYPFGAGGNHLRNIIVTCDPSRPQWQDYDRAHEMYCSESKIVHLYPDHWDHGLGVHQGHFVHFATDRSKIQDIKDQRWILLSPESHQDRQVLFRRQQRLDYPNFVIEPDSYPAFEQMVLYEQWLFCKLFDLTADQVMNIGISQWFGDVSITVQRINDFCGTSIDLERAQRLHQTWLAKNNLI